MRRIEELDTSILVSFEGNPRFETAIEISLLEDIKTNGILVPLLVAPGKNGTYDVIDGERRRQCAKRLKMPKIPCIIEEMDDEVKWQRAFQLNVERQSFSPMEEARHLYERKRRFYYSDKMLADRNSDQLRKSKVTVLVALNKLPDEIKQMIHEKRLAIEPSYQLSRLAFDVEFPATGTNTPRDWADKRKGKIWDFSWEKEPTKWREERIKHQLKLVEKYIKKKLNPDGLKTEIESLRQNEIDKRERKGKLTQELEQAIEKTKRQLSVDLTTHNNELKSIIEELNYPELKKFHFEDKMPQVDFIDFIYDFQTTINERMPKQARMNLMREAKNISLSFRTTVQRKKDIIFEVKEKPTCPHCGQNVKEEVLNSYIDYVSTEYLDLDNLQNTIMNFRDESVQRMNVLKNDIRRLQTLEKDLKELEGEGEED